MMPMMMPMGGKGGWGGGWGNDWRKQMKQDDSGGALGEYKGKIKSYSEKSGYGFIECEELKATYGKDVFLVGGEKKNYQVGNVVKFTAVLNKEGAPGAKSLKS